MLHCVSTISDDKPDSNEKKNIFELLSILYLMITELRFVVVTP